MSGDGGSGRGGAPWSAAEVEACIKVLEAVAADRGALAHLDRADRVRLLEAAGRASRPERAEQRKLAKAFRRRERVEDRAADEALLDATGIRTARRAPVFVTPPALTSLTHSEREPEPEPAPELGSPRKCYVCKAEYRLLH